jgi:hypothetical protein
MKGPATLLQLQSPDQHPPVCKDHKVDIQTN